MGVVARLTPVALRRWMTLGAVVVCGLFALSVTRRTGVGYMTDSFDCYSLELCGGELQLRRGTALPYSTIPTLDCGLRFINACDGDCTFAWRPYHRESAGSEAFHEIDIPLWQAAAGSLIALGYVHGIVRGLRRVDRSRCRVCGTDLAGCAASRCCPSCGTKALSRVGVSCRGCGYDLSGLPRGWRGPRKCPECGTTTLSPR